MKLKAGERVGYKNNKGSHMIVEKILPKGKVEVTIISCWLSKIVEAKQLKRVKRMEKLGNECTGILPTHPDLKFSDVGLGGGNWVKGLYKGLWFEAKVFAEPSTFGINHGRVSKLCISRTNKWVMLSTEHVLFNYDRGMDLDDPMGHELAALFDAVN